MNPWVEQIVRSLFTQPQKTAGLLSDKVTKNRSLNSKARSELSQLLYDAIRWKRKLWGEVEPKEIDLEVLKTEIEKIKHWAQGPVLEELQKLKIDEVSKELSFPTFIVEMWVKQLGLKKTIELCLRLNTPAPQVYRINTLKKDPHQVRAQLQKESLAFETIEGLQNAIVMHDRQNIRGSTLFKEGQLEPQDSASQWVVEVLNVLPGQKVLDACARSGGKSLGIAANMKNQGEIVAADTDARMLDVLKKRAQKSGVKIIKTQWVAPDDPNPLPKYRNYFDVVLVDAPCSGLGILRRKVMSKWLITPGFLHSFPSLQLKLLHRYAQYLKPGGKLGYVTCTIHEAENEKLIEKFIHESDDILMLEKQQQLLPTQKEHWDGFFSAVMYKKTI